MNVAEHLLTLVTEECAEVAQRATKALRFGLDEIQAGQPDHNAERLCYEMRDLITIFAMLEGQGYIPNTWHPNDEQLEAKVDKVHRYMAVSAELGCLRQERMVDAAIEACAAETNPVFDQLAWEDAA